MFNQLVVALAAVSVAFAQSQNYFITPPIPGSADYYANNLVWELGSQQTISWTSNYTTWILALYQNNHGTANPKAICKFLPAEACPFSAPLPRNRRALTRSSSSQRLLQCCKCELAGCSSVPMGREYRS
jgi:hypothetical protein